MKGLGIFLVIAGVIWALIAFNMDTTITTESERYGSGEYAFSVPSASVHNIGLMETRRNHLMFSGLTILAGVVLVGFGSLEKSSGLNTKLKQCPFCAESIQPAALKCRFCNSELQESFQESPSIAMSPKSMNGIASQLALIRQGNASIETYTSVIVSLGGSLTKEGSIFNPRFVIKLDGQENRIDGIKHLRQWFIDNVGRRIGV